MTEETNQAKLEAIEAVIEVIRKVRTAFGQKVFTEGDYLTFRRYALMVVEPACGELDPREMGELLGMAQRGELGGMSEDVGLIRHLSSWFANRRHDLSEALDIVMAKPAPGENPLAGQRGEDMRDLASGRITPEGFRQRSEAWPTE